MRYAILGDIHANLEGLEAVLKDAEEQGVTHFACVGDVVGYNANPTLMEVLVYVGYLLAVVFWLRLGRRGPAGPTSPSPA